MATRKATQHTLTNREKRKAKSSKMIKNTAKIAVPKGRATRERRPIVEAKVEQLKLIKSYYCPALHGDVGIYKFTKREMSKWSSKTRKSTLTVLNFENVIKNATLVYKDDPKTNDRSQSRFNKMFFLMCKVKGVGVAKLTVGKFKSEQRTPYGAYCLTSISIESIQKGKC